MVLNRAHPRKPVIFGKKKTATKREDSEETLDMLLHYAKAGMEEAERSLQETPELFSREERETFLQNKNMLDQAPFLIETYKSKAAEHDALHKKMLAILQKCEEIVANGDDKAKQQIKGVIKDAAIFTYTEDGDIVMKRDAS